LSNRTLFFVAWSIGCGNNATSIAVVWTDGVVFLVATEEEEEATDDAIDEHEGDLRHERLFLLFPVQLLLLLPILFCRVVVVVVTIDDGRSCSGSVRSLVVVRLLSPPLLTLLAALPALPLL
jgi:hypothetical protein